MAHEHPSGFPDTYDRHTAMPDVAGLVYRGRTFPQSAELNEDQSIARARAQRIGNLVARDGDRVAGGAPIIDIEAGSITLPEGIIYAAGDQRRLPERIIDDVVWTGDVSIGIRIHTTYITEEDEPSLVGLVAGALSEGEPGAAREIQTASWSLLSADEPGAYYQVYLARGGTILDQTAPANLSQVAQQIAAGDRGATGGNYIVDGNRVTALGQVGDTMQFSIGEGEANVRGFKRTRATGLRFGEPIAWDTETISAEPHNFDDAGTGTATIPLNNGPVDQITSLLITKQVTETITRGSPNNTADPLGRAGATTIISVVQGGTTYVAGTSYALAANAVNWAAAGAEPAVGSSYQVTYRYLDNVMPATVSTDSLTVAGGVTGSQVLVGYRWKLPRVDRLCLNEFGEVVYLKGISARTRPQPPIAPNKLLGLAEIANDWRGTPSVTNNGTRAVHFDYLWRVIQAVWDVQDLAALSRLKQEMDGREPVAKNGSFVDPCVDDSYRDQGVAQTAAVFGGSIQLAIDATVHPIAMAAPIMLPGAEEIIIQQPLRTGCVLINPYANFDPLPAQMEITPKTDFWTETHTVWTSDITRQISGTTARNTVTTEIVDQRSEVLEFLRSIAVAYTIRGFGPGEVLALLAFDGLVITPSSPVKVAGTNGVITGTFNVPANVVAGSKYLYAQGASGAEAWAEFVGLGTINTTTMRRIITTEVVPPPPDPVPIVVGSSPTLPQNVIVRANRPRHIIINQAKDPQAQSFAPPEPRHITSVDIKLCRIGDRAKGLSVELVPVRDGDPTKDTMAAVPVHMGAVVLDAWTPARWRMPVFVPADELSAFVIKTDDNLHSISVADLGAFDQDNQRWVSSNPYTVGNRHSSSNALSWDHHQGSDITFRLWAMRFTATTRTVVLGTVNLIACSDLKILGTVDLPTAECSFYFEVVRASGAVLKLAPNQNYEFGEYATETITVRAVLKGTATVSPTLYPGVQLIAGKLRATGTYVTRAFKFGAAIDLIARYKARLPAGSAAAISYDKTDNTWIAMAAPTTEQMNDGWVERKHENTAITAINGGRIKITLSGTPAARPSVADPRCFTFF